MNRLGFIQRLMAALGVGGSLGLHSRQSAVPDLLASAPPSFPSILELRRVAARVEVLFRRKPTHFYCNDQTMLDLISTISHVGDYTSTGKDVTVIGLRWVESRYMRDGQLWAGGAPWRWELEPA